MRYSMLWIYLLHLPVVRFHVPICSKINMNNSVKQKEDLIVCLTVIVDPPQNGWGLWKEFGVYI